jgi:hypothetical protein
LLKANKTQINKIYTLLEQKQKDGKYIRGKFSPLEAYLLLGECGLKDTETKEAVILAYSLSKNFLIDEMEDADAHYEHLKRGEYYEFLVRLADLMFRAPDTQRTDFNAPANEDEDSASVSQLCKRLERLLTMLF